MISTPSDPGAGLASSASGPSNVLLSLTTVRPPSGRELHDFSRSPGQSLESLTSGGRRVGRMHSYRASFAAEQLEESVLGCSREALGVVGLMLVRLLGSVRLEGAASVRGASPGVVEVGAPMRRAVLAVLGVRVGRIVTLAELIDGLWGEQAPGSAAGSVYTYVSGLRAVLARARPGGRLLLVGDRAGYCLRVESAEVDALVVEGLRVRARAARRDGRLDTAAALLGEALGLWQGEALAGVPGPFAEAERVRLGELWWSLVEDQAEVLLGLGRHQEVAVELSARVVEQPLRESLATLAMTALYRCGRQADALALFGRVRAVLAEELGVDPGPGLVDLQARILRNTDDLLIPEPVKPAGSGGGGAVAAVAGRQDAADGCTGGVVSGTAVGGPGAGGTVRAVPAQLPHDVVDFAGRSHELAWLRGVVSAESRAGRVAEVTVTISAIDGLAGVGKTALAVRLGHQLAGAFVDGQLYLDLRGFHPTAEPLAVKEALSRLLLGLGEDPRGFPEDVEELAAFYRSRVAGSRLLILLDNAASTEQVRSLLPGTAGSMVVVTSRNRLGGLAARHGARRLTLGVLPLGEARELLVRLISRSRVDAESAAAHELIELCGRLPLALCIAAERVSARGGQPLADLVGEVRESRMDALDSDEDESSAVRGVFSWSYRALPVEQARLFRLLSVHTGSQVGVAAAAAAAGIDPAQARVLLRSLADAHLLEEVGARRYRQHDLLRLYATELLDTGEAAAAAARVVACYLHTLASAFRLTTPGVPRPDPGPVPDGVSPVELDGLTQAQEWTKLEASNLIDCLQLAREHGLDEPFCQLVLWMRLVLENGGRLPQWEAVLTDALAAAERLGDRRAEALLYNDRCLARLMKGGSGAAAAEDALRARALFTELDDPIGAARAAGNHAAALQSLGQIDEAIRLLGQVRDELAAAGDRDGVARAIDNINWMLEERGDWPAILESSSIAADLFSRAGSEYDALIARLLVANARYRTGDSKAGQQMRDLVQGAEDIGHHRAANLGRTYLGTWAVEEQDLSAALDYLTDAAHQLKDVNAGDYADCLVPLGQALHGLGRDEEARAAWTEALAVHGLKTPNGRRAATELADLEAAVDDYTTAGG